MTERYTACVGTIIKRSQVTDNQNQYDVCDEVENFVRYYFLYDVRVPIASKEWLIYFYVSAVPHGGYKCVPEEIQSFVSRTLTKRIVRKSELCSNVKF